MSVLMLDIDIIITFLLSQSFLAFEKFLPQSKLLLGKNANFIFGKSKHFLQSKRCFFNFMKFLLGNQHN
jgi:hypothetical protein